MGTITVVDPLVWLRAELARYTYRPGWRMRIEVQPAVAGQYTPARLVVEYTAPDAYHPEREIPLKVNVMVPWDLAEAHGASDLFGRWLQHTLQDVELHESREWLRLDGCLLDDPHAAGRQGL